MTRDMALSWRIKKFIAEVEHDSEVINDGIKLMVLNLVCHLVPLNLFLFQSQMGMAHTCVPAWVVLFVLAQAIGLVS